MLEVGVTLQSYTEKTTFKIDMIILKMFHFLRIIKRKIWGLFWRQWQNLIIVTEKKNGTILVGKIGKGVLLFCFVLFLT